MKASQNRGVRFIQAILVCGLFSKSLFALCVDDEKANLRQGPGLNFTKTFEAIRYMPLKKLSKQAGWYRVEDLDGKVHWVKENLVTGGYSCAAVKSDYANLRTGPGLEFKTAKASKGDKYLSFRVIQSKGRWVKLEDVEGDEVWAARDNLWIQ